MKYLDIPYFKQDTGFTCGPASLQMVLRYCGIVESEEALRSELDTNASIGTDHQHLIDAILRRDLHCYVNNQSSIEEITYLFEQKIAMIVHFIESSDCEDHYSVIVGLSDNQIVLHDPWNGERLHYTHAEFLKRWTCDALGTCTKWLLAVSKEPLSLGKQFHP